MFYIGIQNRLYIKTYFTIISHKYILLKISNLYTINLEYFYLMDRN